LASHRRWHKPRVPGATKRREPPSSDGGRFPCQRCGKLFRRQAYLRKHLLAHDQPDNDEKEPSAFRQVHTEYPNYQTVSFFSTDIILFLISSWKYYLCVIRIKVYDLPSVPIVKSSNFQETLRDNNFNTFWNKIPPPQQDLSWEGVATRCASSCSSEDSRSLDVTGSEDEGGGGLAAGGEG
jgi:hypothetical protein